MTPVSAGRRVADRGERPRRRFRPGLMLLAVGVTLAVVAWGYLVYAAVDFGAAARAGEDRAWWYLGLASLGAVACLFTGLLLVARLLQTVRTGSATASRGATTARPPALPGGKHAR